MWLPKFSDHWGGIFAVTTGVYSDFDKVTSEAIRVTGRALVRWDMVPDEIQWMAGVIVLNRADVRVLPAIGADLVSGGTCPPRDDFSTPQVRLAIGIRTGPVG
jgi:hypothetical protein